MKLYLWGPKAGQTILINGIQFINGVAEAPSLPIYHERYYNVKDHPPVLSDGPQSLTAQALPTSLDPNITHEEGWGKEAEEFSGKAVMDSLDLPTARRLPDAIDNAEADLRSLVEARKAIIEAKAEAAAREEALAKAEPKASPFAMNPNKKSSKPIDAKYERNPSMSYVEQMNTYGTWGEMRKFVMLSVGRDINDKKEAIKALEYLDNQK